MTLIVALVCVAYAGIQYFELAAVLARVSGVRAKSVMLGYTLQQSVYMVTRFLLIILLPVVGFLVDSNIEMKTYYMMTHISLFLAALGGIFLAVRSGLAIQYFERVIAKYKSGAGYLASLIGSLKFRPPAGSTKIGIPRLSNYPWKLLIFSNIVFTIYSTGVFVSFYFALEYYPYRATISQMSGIANALGAVIITFYIEPRISKAIDAVEENAENMISALFWGRLFSIMITGQVLLFIVFTLS